MGNEITLWRLIIGSRVGLKRVKISERKTFERLIIKTHECVIEVKLQFFDSKIFSNKFNLWCSTAGSGDHGFTLIKKSYWI